MKDKEFKSLITLLFWTGAGKWSNGPGAAEWPASKEDATVLNALANREAKKRKHPNWLAAYHEMKRCRT